MAATVKFLHPGAEWTSRLDRGVAPWALVDAGHTRRYLQAPGQFLRKLDGPLEDGPIGFWGEYEAPTAFERLAHKPAPGLPEFVQTPVPLAQVQRPVGALNTDPLVLGSYWVYSNCQQRSRPSLRRLGRGDVIIFGSLKRSYVIDTVFVVAEAIRFVGGQARGTVGDRVPQYAHYLVLDLLWPGDYTLYLGATYEKPVDGRFSFVPAVPAAERPAGFARPAAPPSLQSRQGQGIKIIDGSHDHWRALAQAVVGQGLCLGVSASLAAHGVQGDGGAADAGGRCGWSTCGVPS